MNLNENVRISIKISLKFVPKGPINNIPALAQIMAWRRSGDKPLSKPMMVSLLTHIYASLGLNELIDCHIYSSAVSFFEVSCLPDVHTLLWYCKNMYQMETIIDALLGNTFIFVTILNMKI